MPTFKVTFADRETGRESHITVEATDKHDAMAKVQDGSTQVSGVVEVVRPHKAGRASTTGGGTRRASREYTTAIVAEGAFSTAVTGQSNISLDKLNATLNEYAAEGWELEFMFTEHRRFVLFWAREAVIVTFSRPV